MNKTISWKDYLVATMADVPDSQTVNAELDAYMSWRSKKRRRMVESFRDFIIEGGNVDFDGQGADHLDLTKLSRDSLSDQILTTIKVFSAEYLKATGRLLFSKKALDSGSVFSGSTIHFLSKKIPTSEFVAHKKVVSDIDLKVNISEEKGLLEFLHASKGKTFGPTKLIGVKTTPLGQFGLFELNDPKIKFQVDFEPTSFETSNEPTKFSIFARSSDWKDVKLGIKGVFHKYLVSTLVGLHKDEIIVLSNKKNVPSKKVISRMAFNVSKGLRDKLEPVIDDKTGAQKKIDGLLVFREIPVAASTYSQDLKVIYSAIFKHEPSPEHLEKFHSYIGILSLIKEYLSQEDQVKVIDRFAGFLWDEGTSRIHPENPETDRKIKTTAFKVMTDTLKIPYDTQRIQKLEADYYAVKEDVIHEEVVTTKRSAIVHLQKMADVDFVHMVKELGGGMKDVAFTLKVDGTPGRFGKDASGRPFFESPKYSGPAFEKGAFVAYVKNKGGDDGDVQRAQKFDEIWEFLTSRFNSVIPNDTKIIAEVLYNPKGTETPNGIKFVSVTYDPNKLGSVMTVVPITVLVSSAGAIHPEKDAILGKLLKASTAEIKVVSPTLFLDKKNPSLNFEGVINPVAAFDDESIRILTSLKGADKEKKTLLKGVIEKTKNAFAQHILDHPSILGKDVLGREIEGIVMNVNGRTVKVTSPEFKAHVASKRPKVPVNS